MSGKPASTKKGRPGKSWGQRHYLFFAFVLFLMLLGLVLVSYGYSLSSSFFNTRGISSETVFKGMLLGWSNSTAIQNHTTVLSVNNVYVQMKVSALTKEVDVWLAFQARLAQAHSFAIILPFPIHNATISTAETIGGSVSSLKSENVSESSSVLQFTWVPLKNYSYWASAGAGVTTYATGDLVSSLKGEYELYLPVGIYPPADVVRDAQNSVAKGVSFPSPSSFFEINYSQISVVLPADSKLEQLIPSYADVERTTNSLILNMQNLFAASSVTVDYQDSNVVGAYQNELFLGGLWVGIGSSVLLGGVFEVARFFYEFESARIGSPPADA